MRRLAAAPFDSVTEHRKIVQSRSPEHRERLENAALVVEARIKRLEVDGPIGLAEDDLGQSPDHSDNPGLRRDLLKLWNGRSTHLSELKIRLLKHHGDHRCPFCGLDRASSFDHYLPKSRYPEFSVAAANLIPACRECNGLKGDQVAVEGRRFLHPWIDPLDIELLECELDTSRPLPGVDFRVRDDLVAEVAGDRDLPLDREGAEELAAACRFHLDRLQLVRRYVSTATARLAEFLLMLEEQGIPHGVTAARIARDIARVESSRDEPNNCLRLLFLAVAEWMEGEG